MEKLLKEKILNFSEFLIKNCESEDKIKEINDKIKNLQFYEIIIFIQFLKKENIEKETNIFIKSFSIIDSLEVREKIYNQLDYFISVKKILNN